MPPQNLSVDCAHLKAFLETVNQKRTSFVIVAGPISRVNLQKVSSNDTERALNRNTFLRSL